MTLAAQLENVRRIVWTSIGLPYVPSQPRGKGVFVRSIAHGGATDAAFTHTVRSAGIRWVMLLAESVNDRMADGRIPIERYPALARSLRAQGIDVWVWGWPDPTTVDDFATRVGSIGRACQASGVMLDLEGPWVHRNAAQEARSEAALRNLVRKLRGELPAVAFTSFGGGPQFFGREIFPWELAAELCDWGCPQLYAQPNSGGPIPSAKQMKDWQKSWADLMGPRVVPVLGAANPSPADLEVAAGRAETRMGALCWWDLYFLTRNPAKLAAVRDIAVRGDRRGLFA